MEHTHRASSRNLTPLYCLHQAAYFFAMAGVGAFAVTYLMGRGFGAAQTGVLLAATNILSCVLQPAIGGYADRTSITRLQKIIPAFLVVSLISFACLSLLPLPLPAVGLLYLTGQLGFSITIPIFNPLCARYAASGCAINYGAGNGVGSLSFSFASLAFGYIIAYLGSRAMILVVLLFIALQLFFVLRYPPLKPEAGGKARAAAGLSFPAFCRKYRCFMLTMLGVMLLAACHAMAENYLIKLFERIGGGSEHVGIALFIACITDAPFMLYFERIQKRVNVALLIRLSGFFYMLKAVLLIFAPSITSIYLIELIQTFTYAFIYPSLYYLVIRRIRAEDMARGQTIASATFTLGMALGNALGGVIIEHIGLNAMLLIAAGIACAGTALVCAFVSRQDAAA